MKKIFFVLILLLFASRCGFGTVQNKYYEKAVYTDEYGLSFYPEYPPTIGETITLRLRTFVPAQKVTLYSDREEEIPMTYRQGHWWGKFTIPEDYKEGGHFFTVWIRYTMFDPRGFRPFWQKSVVWYRAFRKKEVEIETLQPTPEVIISFPPLITFEVEELPLSVTGEAIEIKVVSPEAAPLLIKGSQSITFRSISLEGSKEGYTPGTIQTREETLRLNISGRAADTDIEATLYRTTATGISLVGEREEKISILMRRGSTEAYLGDFTADLNETEFAGLNKVLSGGRIKGDYGRFGVTALYSSPRGTSKHYKNYGDGTQGPYRLTSKKIVIDSERVYVDSVRQSRGNDYDIDYEAGTLTFKSRTIPNLSVIEVYFDEKETIYQHSTYALRPTFKPNPNLKLGLTYINDSDSLQGVTEVKEGTTPPQSHHVFGLDGSYVSERLSLNSEIAYSDRNLNIFSSTGTRETGEAFKIDLGSQFGPFGIQSSFKRVGEKFVSIADPNPKQDVTDYSGLLSFRPGSIFGARGSYGYNKYTQNQVIYENIYKTARAQLTPERFPSLEYNFSEIDESNDPVTGSSIQRVITKNSAETTYQFSFLSTSLKGTLEKWLRRSPSEEATDYKKINFGLATIGLEKITFSSNVELEDRREPGGLSPSRKTFNLKLSANPSKQYFISTSLEHIDDSLQGITNVTDLSYRAQPSSAFRSDGKYTITSVNEDYPQSPSSQEGVSKHSGSFSFDFRPGKNLRLRYLYKPNFTEISRTQTRSYNNEQQQAEINLIPVKQVLIGTIYKIGKSFSTDKDDYPNYQRKKEVSDSDSILYTLKMAPFQVLSTEFNYLLENKFTTSLATAEPLTYNRGRGRVRKFGAVVRTSLSERFSIDSRYTYQKTDQGSGEADSNLVDTISHTGSLKGSFNFSNQLTLTVSGSFGQTLDELLSQTTYTVSPGVGIIYRLDDKLRVDFDYTYSKSYAGAETEKSNYSLKTKYSLSDYVNLTLRGEQEISRAPDYRFTDITGNLEINL